MASSSIRVAEETLARLRVLSKDEQRPIGQIVTDLVKKYERDKFFKQMHEDFTRLRADPGAWKEYQDEALLWQGGTAVALSDEDPVARQRRKGKSMPSTPHPMAGEVWTILFEPVVGREHGGLRPGWILSNDVYNAIPHELRIGVPITGTDRGVATHLPIKPPEGGLSKPRVAMCEQVAAQGLLRFRRKHGEVSPETFAQVQAVVGMFIDQA